MSWFRHKAKTKPRTTVCFTIFNKKGGVKMKVIKQGVSPVSVTTKGQIVKSVPGSLR